MGNRRWGKRTRERELEREPELERETSDDDAMWTLARLCARMGCCVASQHSHELEQRATAKGQIEWKLLVSSARTYALLVLASVTEVRENIINTCHCAICIMLC